ncbi:MAG: glycosyltransferase family 2 protein [Oscillospiraceae bacterium]|nr:glycosyltransferase family 2 protein [Oscillospiraceae bacterium]
MNTIDLVVPCYNEEAVLPESAPVLLGVLRELVARGLAGPDSRLLLVDDGSADRTWGLIEGLCAREPEVCGLKLRCNRGHQNAVMAGLLTAARHADAAVTIDADLQDDPQAIADMARQFVAGTPIVCGVRASRASDSFLKRVTARGFYVLVRLGGAKVIFDHADFRLMSREAIRRLSCFGTEDLFLRGLVTRLGLPIGTVRYDRSPRLAGESKYTLKKMLHLARRGFQSGRMKMAKTPQIGDLCIERELLQ